MSLSNEERRLHGEYEAADPIIKKAIDRAYDAVRKEFEDVGFDCANDDRAESLACAIYRYLIDSTTLETCDGKRKI